MYYVFNRIVFTLLQFFSTTLFANINQAFRVNKYHLQLLCNFLTTGKSIPYLMNALFTVMNTFVQMDFSPSRDSLLR